MAFATFGMPTSKNQLPVRNHARVVPLLVLQIPSATHRWKKSALLAHLLRRYCNPTNAEREQAEKTSTYIYLFRPVRSYLHHAPAATARAVSPPPPPPLLRGRAHLLKRSAFHDRCCRLHQTRSQNGRPIRVGSGHDGRRRAPQKQVGHNKRVNNLRMRGTPRARTPETRCCDTRKSPSNGEEPRSRWTTHLIREHQDEPVGNLFGATTVRYYVLLYISRTIDEANDAGSTAVSPSACLGTLRLRDRGCRRPGLVLVPLPEAQSGRQRPGRRPLAALGAAACSIGKVGRLHEDLHDGFCQQGKGGRERRGLTGALMGTWGQIP